MFIISFLFSWSAWIAFFIYAIIWWGWPNFSWKIYIFMSSIVFWIIGRLAKRAWERGEFDKALAQIEYLREMPMVEAEEQLRMTWAQSGMSAPKRVRYPKE